MTLPFTEYARRCWEELITEALRLDNPKVKDMSGVRKAARKANRMPMPQAEQDNYESPFYRLVIVAMAFEGGDPKDRAVCLRVIGSGFDAISRQLCIDAAYGSRAILLKLQGRSVAEVEPVDLRPPQDPVDHEYSWRNRADIGE